MYDAQSQLSYLWDLGFGGAKMWGKCFKFIILGGKPQIGGGGGEDQFVGYIMLIF